jgi:hypothetical protein
MTGIIMCLDPETQQDLLAFYEENRDKKNQILGKVLLTSIIEKLISGEAMITGSVTDHNQKKMWVEFSFFREDEQ